MLSGLASARSVHGPEDGPLPNFDTRNLSIYLSKIFTKSVSVQVKAELNVQWRRISFRALFNLKGE